MNKYIKVTLLAVLGILIVFFIGAFTGETESVGDSVSEVVFPHDSVIDVYIEIDEDTLNEMYDNAMAEEYVLCNVVYNGYYIKNVGIRPKGNSSLMQVASTDSDRYSFKLDFNEYISGQSLFGITKINLNNNFGDPSMMREYLSYEISEMLGLPTPQTTYVALYINNEYYGLYLSVENVDEYFINENFSYTSGDLFKPEGTGSDLNYIDDNPDSYTGLGLQTNTELSDLSSVINMLEILANGDEEAIEEVIDTDAFIKYYALCMSVVSLDTILGGMDHNYYLYENYDEFTIIPWDFNLAFGGFAAGSTADLQIDEITKISDKPIITELLSMDGNLEKYHEYIQQIIDEYMNEEYFNARVNEIVEMIGSYVESDPNLFYSYSNFLAAVTEGDSSSSLITFNAERVESMEKQLSGELPTTSDSSTAQISFMGNAGGMMGGRNPGQMMGGEDGQMQMGMRPGFPTDDTSAESQDAEMNPGMMGGEDGQMQMGQRPGFPTDDTSGESQDAEMNPGMMGPGNRPGMMGGMPDESTMLQMIPEDILNSLIEEYNETVENQETQNSENVVNEAESDEEVIVVNGLEIDTQMKDWIIAKMMEMRDMGGQMGGQMKGDMNNLDFSDRIKGDFSEETNSTSQVTSPATYIATFLSTIVLIIVLLFITFKKKI